MVLVHIHLQLCIFDINYRYVLLHVVVSAVLFIQSQCVLLMYPVYLILLGYTFKRGLIQFYRRNPFWYFDNFF